MRCKATWYTNARCCCTQNTYNNHRLMMNTAHWIRIKCVTVHFICVQCSVFMYEKCGEKSIKKMCVGPYKAKLKDFLSSNFEHLSWFVRLYFHTVWSIESVGFSQNVNTLASSYIYVYANTLVLCVYKYIYVNVWDTFELREKEQSRKIDKFVKGSLI